jgi:predicted RNA-binding Zn-ribbon protein involved in translation (DUF1610 family)
MWSSHLSKDNVINLDDFRKTPDNYFVALALCVSCTRRWIATLPASASLVALECPQCGDQNSFASILPKEFTDSLLEK